MNVMGFRGGGAAGVDEEVERERERAPGERTLIRDATGLYLVDLKLDPRYPEKTDWVLGRPK